jgi:lipoprotein NlpD
MRYAVVLLLLALASCTSTLVDYEARVHVVQPGDTLYTIAWRHGVDHRLLAGWNNLSNPDLIFVGQRIRLMPPASASSASAVRRPPASAPRPTAPARAPEPEAPVLPPPQWQWPMRGPIVSAYGDRRGIASGIGIGGSVGQPIEAAAAGRVVYTGSGLIGYGELVILKHNDTYLSAYGHLSRVLVVQGQDVRRGEKIAEMGVGPQRQPRLHFEIRRNGVPVDPALLLGSRG